VFGNVFVGGSTLRRVAKALIPNDVSILSNKQVMDDSFGCERELKEKKMINLVPSRNNPMEPLLLNTRAISLDQLGYRRLTT